MSASGKYCEIFCLCGRVPAAPGSNVSFGLDKIEPIAVSQERFRGGQLGAAPPQGRNDHKATNAARPRIPASPSPI